MAALTFSAVSFSPVEKAASSRIFTVQVSWSSLTVGISAASQGAGVMSMLNFISVSHTP